MDRLQRAQYINNWMQTIAIVIGGIWVLGYNFIYSDLYKSSISPAHVTSSIYVEANDPVNGYIPLSVQMEIENESKIDTYILPGILIVWGVKSEPADPDKKHTDFLKEITQAASKDTALVKNKYLIEKQVSIVAGGSVFKEDILLSPNEDESREIIIHIPENKFDIIEVRFEFWAHKKIRETLSSKIEFIDDINYINEPCIINTSDPWECNLITSDKNGDKVKKKLGLSYFNSRAKIPLQSTGN